MPSALNNPLLFGSLINDAAVIAPTVILLVVEDPLPVTLSKVSVSDPPPPPPPPVLVVLYARISTESSANRASFRTIDVPFDAV